LRSFVPRETGEEAEAVIGGELSRRSLRVNARASGGRVWSGGSFHRCAMHDGQNVWDDHDCCFGHTGWEINVTLDAEIAAGTVAPIIVIAADNTTARNNEYGLDIPSRASVVRFHPKRGARPAAESARVRVLSHCSNPVVLTGTRVRAAGWNSSNGSDLITAARCDSVGGTSGYELARNSFAARAISAGWCSLLKLIRSRAVPSGTVGGRMACTKIPASSQAWLI